MFYKPKVYTVESVTSGHPDKVCDQISDVILDECLKQDPESRVAVEVLGSHGLLVIGGEVTTRAELKVEDIASNLYKQLGYGDNLKIISHLVKQSPDIAQGVNVGGAGDQGIMYGYAIKDEASNFMPKSVALVHSLTRGLERMRMSGNFPWLGPDGKAQITMDGDRIKTILVSCQHAEEMTQTEIKKNLIEHLIRPLVGDVSGVEILVNPTGKFVIGGFAGDAGLTGRKIMVDTYCGLVPHGGGAFSGKDATKVDRSAAYMARFAAKNIVASGLADECLISVAYAIGRAEPLMVHAIDGQGKDLSAAVKERKFDFRPNAIIERLDLKKPIYLQTAAYGHFGKDNLPWEKII